MTHQEDLQNLEIKEGEKLCVVAQTTFNYKKFQYLVEIIERKRYDIIVVNTICNATEERQAEAARLARQSDAMIVIGGKQSSNTGKLFEISSYHQSQVSYNPARFSPPLFDGFFLQTGRAVGRKGGLLFRG